MKPVEPGTRPIPIANYGVPAGLFPFPTQPGIEFIPHNHQIDGQPTSWVMNLSISTPHGIDAPLFASIGGLTDRSRIEAGLLHHDVHTGVSTVQIYVPATWRGSINIFSLPPQPENPEPQQLRQWWMSALQSSIFHTVAHAPDAPRACAQIPQDRYEKTILSCGRRTIHLYTDPSCTDSYPGLLVFDGHIFEPMGLMNRIGEKPIPWVAFVYHGSTPQRNEDLCCNDTFTKEVLDTIPAGPCIAAGSSFGGLGSLWAHIRQPERVCGAIGMSTPWVRMPEDIWDGTHYNLIADNGQLEWLMKPSFELIEEKNIKECTHFMGGHDRAWWIERLIPHYTTLISE